MNNVITRSPAARSCKAWLLGTVSTLAMCATVPSLGWASEILPPETMDGTVNGYTTLLANVSNVDTSLSAMITHGTVAITGAGSSYVTTANSFTASAGGNSVTNLIPLTGTMLPLPSSPTDFGNLADGVAVLNDSLNVGVVATALVGNNTLGQQVAASVSAATVSEPTRCRQTSHSTNPSPPWRARFRSAIRWSAASRHRLRQRTPARFRRSTAPLTT